MNNAFLWSVVLTITLPIQALAVEPTEEEEIEKTYNAWTRATDAKDIEQWSSFLASNPLFLPPGSPPLQTREAIAGG